MTDITHIRRRVTLWTREFSRRQCFAFSAINLEMLLRRSTNYLLNVAGSACVHVLQDVLQLAIQEADSDAPCDIGRTQRLISDLDNLKLADVCDVPVGDESADERGVQTINCAMSILRLSVQHRRQLDHRRQLAVDTAIATVESVYAYVVWDLRTMKPGTEFESVELRREIDRLERLTRAISSGATVADLRRKFTDSD